MHWRLSRALVQCRSRPQAARWARLCPTRGTCSQDMIMRRNLTRRERYVLGTGRLPDDHRAALMKRDAASQIGEAKGGYPISTISRSDKVEQHLILRNGQCLAIAE